MVKVKGLFWEQHTWGVHRAETLFGDYRVWTHGAANGNYFWQLSNHGQIASGEGTEERCLSSAQADYEGRVLSMLEEE